MRVAWVDDVASIRLIGQCLIERSGGSCVVFEDHASLLASGDSAETWSQAGIDLAAFDGFVAKPFMFGELREALGLDADRGEVAS